MVLAEDDGYDGNEDPRAQKQSIIVVCTPSRPLSDLDVEVKESPTFHTGTRNPEAASPIPESVRCSGHWITWAGVLHALSSVMLDAVQEKAGHTSNLSAHDAQC